MIFPLSSGHEKPAGSLKPSAVLFAAEFAVVIRP